MRNVNAYARSSFDRPLSRNHDRSGNGNNEALAETSVMTQMGRLLPVCFAMAAQRRPSGMRL